MIGVWCLSLPRQQGCVHTYKPKHIDSPNEDEII